MFRCFDSSRLAGRLEALNREREHLAEDLRASELEVDVKALRPTLERRLSDLGAVLSGRHPELACRALRELFRDERLRVGPDPERGFLVEGTAWLRVLLENGTARNPQG